MKTAKKIAETYINKYDSKKRVEQITEEIINYAKQKCKSQRIICARYVANSNIKNSPKPEFK